MERGAVLHMIERLGVVVMDVLLWFVPPDPLPVFWLDQGHISCSCCPIWIVAALVVDEPELLAARDPLEAVKENDVLVRVDFVEGFMQGTLDLPELAIHLDRRCSVINPTHLQAGSKVDGILDSLIYTTPRTGQEGMCGISGLHHATERRHRLLLRISPEEGPVDNTAIGRVSDETFRVIGEFWHLRKGLENCFGADALVP